MKEYRCDACNKLIEDIKFSAIIQSFSSQESKGQRFGYSRTLVNSELDFCCLDCIHYYASEHGFNKVKEIKE